MIEVLTNAMVISFAIYKCITLMCYTPYLHNVICQLYLNKGAGVAKKKIGLIKEKSWKEKKKRG